MRIPQVNFSKGELGPQLYGRFDVDAWQSALRTARNVIIMKYGGVTKRPGTRLVGQVLNSAEPTMLVPFQFSMTQTYALEMGQGYMAPCASGGRILEGEQPITAISNAAYAQLTIAYHGFAVGDLIYIDGVDGGMGALLNFRTWTVVSVVDANTVTIDANTALAPSFSGCTGGTANSAPPVVVPPPVVRPPTIPLIPPFISYGGGLGGFRLKD
jgi:hypothetical protein